MQETILLYNIKSDEVKELIKRICEDQGIRICSIAPEQYGIPVGILAGGTRQQQEEFQAQCQIPEAFGEEMMVFAFLTNKRVGQFLSEMRKHEIPRIGLKAVLTEYNAVWNSAMLYEELCKEEEAMAFMKKSGKPEA